MVLDTYTEACRTSTALIGEALARARFWSDHRAVPLNAMERILIGKMLDAGPGRFEGGLTARKCMAIAGTTKVTASRHLADLLEKGLIVRAAGPLDARLATTLHSRVGSGTHRNVADQAS